MTFKEGETWELKGGVDIRATFQWFLDGQLVRDESLATLEDILHDTREGTVYFIANANVNGSVKSSECKVTKN